MVEFKKAYIAGIVDGEGTVTLMKHHKNETPILINPKGSELSVLIKFAGVV